MMWSFTYGLIALALAAFVLMYAALHAPSFAPANIADQLYSAKKALNASLPYMRVTTGSPGLNEIAVLRDEITIPTQSGYVYITLLRPIAALVSRTDGLVNYTLFLGVVKCNAARLPRGENATLYEIEVRHPVDVLPWLEATALVPVNSSFYLQYYEYYNQTGRIPPLGLLADYAVEVDVESALVATCSNGSCQTKLYVVAPAVAEAVYITDYPLKIPLSCK